MMFEAEIFVEVDSKQFEASFLTIFGDSFNGRDQGWVFWEANFIGVVDDITYIRVDWFVRRAENYVLGFRSI
jgi:hypothetical protein